MPVDSANSVEETQSMMSRLLAIAKSWSCGELNADRQLEMQNFAGHKFYEATSKIPYKYKTFTSASIIA